jgi:multidrug efflux pump subunit AcrA (membrane-fusion protein)
MSLQPSLPIQTPEQAAATSANGDAHARPTRLPQGKRGRSASRFILPAVALLLLVVGGTVWGVWFRGPQVRADLVTAKVEYKDLQLKITERGTLEAKENRDVKCEVKTGSRGAPKIKSVVENGAQVKKGDLLVEIDDSYLQEQATDQKIVRDKAESDKITAELGYPSKKTAIGLAEKNLEKWIKGDYPQQLHDLEGQIQTSESNLLQEEDRTSWVARMVKKNYMTASQEEAERALLMGYKLDLQKKQEQKKVLTDYTDPTTRQSLDNAILDAKIAEQTAKSTMENNRAVFLQQDAKYKDLLDQIAQCKVTAQYDGIVVYAVPEQTRFGQGSTQSIIAQGEPVQYGQKMMSIPDLSHMLVNVRIHEAFINHMKNHLDVTVRVDAAPGKALRAKVKSVANVASQQDWMSPDVKVYQAYVEIKDSLEGLKLKPGLSAVCTIFTDDKASHVLAVPVQAVVSPLEKNGKPRCFVKTATGAEARDVELGMTDERYVEIKSGLEEGDDVVLNPRVLLSDKEKKGGRDDDKIMGKPGKGRPDGDKGGNGDKPAGGGNRGGQAYQK